MSAATLLAAAGDPRLWLGNALWLLGWGAAFSVSALVQRLGWHGSTRADVVLSLRDLTAAAVAMAVWLQISPAAGSDGGTLLQRALVADGPTALDGGLLLMAAALTTSYLALWRRHGTRRQPTPAMYRQRHPLIPLRIAAFALFQQLAATLLLLDWQRRFVPLPWALLQTALLFGLTHLGVAGFGLSPRHGVLLTLASATAMTVWGGLRLHEGRLWAPVLLHAIGYLLAAAWHARR